MLDNKELQVWAPVMCSSLTTSEKKSIIRSSEFLKRNTLPDGSFDKCKARLVTGGDQQDKELYEDLSSPTVSTCGVLCIIATAATENRHAAVVDIGSAFINASMTTGVNVHMRLYKTMTELL